MKVRTAEALPSIRQSTTTQQAPKKQRHRVENMDVGQGLYTGDYIEGVGMDGQGSLTYRDGSQYVGGFLRGKYHGEGQLIVNATDGARGTWLMGNKDGEFEERWDGGRQYFRGKYENGVRNGFGILKMADGKVYEGEFENDRFHGQGKLVMADSDQTYRGEFRQGSISGRGTICWLKKGLSTYDGEVVDGVRNGFGVFKDPNNNTFVGYWKDDKKHGEGYFITELGAKYKMVFNFDHEVEKELELK